MYYAIFIPITARLQAVTKISSHAIEWIVLAVSHSLLLARLSTYNLLLDNLHDSAHQYQHRYF